jgi:hypothetical protein
MNAAAMSSEQHERGIHVVSAGAREGGRPGSVPDLTGRGCTLTAPVSGGVRWLRIRGRSARIDKIGKLSGAGNPGRRVGTPVAWQSTTIDPSRGYGHRAARIPERLRSDIHHVRAGVTKAANRANADDRDPISPIVSCILPAIA